MNDHPTPEPVRLRYRRQTFTMAPGSTLQAAIRACGLDPELMLAVKDGQLITDTSLILQPGDQVKLLAAFSGG